MIDSRFTEKDLNDVFTFEFEKPKFGLLGKAEKLATCKVEKEVNGELKPCSFKTSEASAMKSFNLWRHVKCNHPENYAALVTKKDQEDKAKQKADAAKRRSSGSLKTPGEKIFCEASSEKKPKIEQTRLDSYLSPQSLKQTTSDLIDPIPEIRQQLLTSNKHTLLLWCQGQCKSAVEPTCNGYGAKARLPTTQESSISKDFADAVDEAGKKNSSTQPVPFKIHDDCDAKEQEIVS
ncbi:hypothetical protein UY3_01271 [Chelonia mydas]|uniref:Uncharacterized protein n=1 Tax=Chelonia mydas TaxID=8469 RepID=M7CA02_CHEMY|nr:hypothetical protein UY3_01271 [Chelonia mydas]